MTADRFTFLHAADLHIDSPLRGLERYEEGPAEEIRGATRKAFENLVRRAIESRSAAPIVSRVKPDPSPSKSAEPSARNT